MNNPYIEQRKRIEKGIIMRICEDKGTKITKLQRGYNGRVLTLSPFSLHKYTNRYVSHKMEYAYSGLSKKIHDSTDTDRYLIEEEINEIIPIKKEYLSLVFTNDFNNYRNVRLYCDKYKIPMISKKQYEQLKKLMKKWRIASVEEHYQMTRQEKRVIKKRYKSTRWDK